MQQQRLQAPLRRLQLGKVQLAYRDRGTGVPILCIHGSWDDHHSWNGVAAILSRRYRVISYDRRGHSASTEPGGQGHLNDDVADALALIDHLALGPSHIIGHSYGANVAIALAGASSGSTRSLFVHEPPLFSLLKNNPELELLRSQAVALMQQTADLIESGEIESAAKLFIEQVAFGKGSWKQLFSPSDRRTILSNVDTWLDQFRDPQRLAVDITKLQSYPQRITLSTGSTTLPCYQAVNEIISQRLTAAYRVTIEGAAHGAHISHAEAVAKAIDAHLKLAAVDAA